MYAVTSCPQRLSAQNKLCPRLQRGKRKIRAMWTVWPYQGQGESFTVTVLFIRNIASQ